MSKQMIFVPVSTLKTLPTLTTLKSFLFGVRQFVSTQTTICRETPQTNITFMFLDASMSNHMVSKRIRPSEPVTTNLALMRFNGGNFLVTVI